MNQIIDTILKSIRKTDWAFLADNPNVTKHPIYGDSVVVSVDESESESFLMILRSKLPIGFQAEHTGNSDTSGDGETTEDVRIWYDPEDAAVTKFRSGLVGFDEALSIAGTGRQTFERTLSKHGVSRPTK